MQPKEFSPEIPLTCSRILTRIRETNFRTSQFETQMQFIKQQVYSWNWVWALRKRDTLQYPNVAMSVQRCDLYLRISKLCCGVSFLFYLIFKTTFYFMYNNAVTYRQHNRVIWCGFFSFSFSFYKFSLSNIWAYACSCVCMCVFIHNTCMQYLQRREEGTGAPGSEVGVAWRGCREQNRGPEYVNFLDTEPYL